MLTGADAITRHFRYRIQARLDCTYMCLNVYNSLFLANFKSRCLYRARIFSLLRSPRNRFQRINFASLCSLAGRYDNPILTRFLIPIDCFKIPALYSVQLFLVRCTSFVLNNLFFQIVLKYDDSYFWK
jgi:hypothetical protein